MDIICWCCKELTSQFQIIDFLRNLELDREEQNFVKLTKIILDIIPKHLRTFFVNKWNEKFPQAWKSDKTSGTTIDNNIPKKRKKQCRFYFSIKDKIQEGDEKRWDITILTFVLLFSGLELIEGCREKNERDDQLLESEEIDNIREMRNTYFAHIESMRCSSNDFEKMITGIKTAVDRLFGQHAKTEVCDIESSNIGNEMIMQLKDQLEEEKNRNRMFEEMLENIKGKAY